MSLEGAAHNNKQQRSTLSESHTPYMQHAQHMWHSCNLTPPARPRCTRTSKWDTTASPTSRIAATSISGVLLLNFGQDLIGLTPRLAGIKALRDTIEHARCATIECWTQAFQLLSLIALTDEGADDPLEDEHHVNFACSGYVYAGQLFPDLFSQTTSTVGHFLSQPNPSRVAKFLTWVGSMPFRRPEPCLV